MKNLLFIMTDQQRADTLHMVQCGREVTPNLNRLAEQSVEFERAYTTCPLCVPARTALATGVYPTKTKVIYNDWDGNTAQSIEPIHTRLQNLGYQVGHIGVDHVQVKPAMREQGYHTFESQSDYATWAKTQGISVKREPEQATNVKELVDGAYLEKSYSNHKAFLWNHDFESFKDKWFYNKAVDFLNEVEEQPFALFTYFWAPHPPFKVPEPYFSMYDSEQVVLPSYIGEIGEGEPALRRDGVPAQLAAGVSVEEWKKSWAAYLGLVTMVDDLIGNLLLELERTGKAEDTIVIFTADHGEHLGSHAMYQKMEMYEESVKIPLLIRNHGIPHRKVQDVVSHLDLVPTVLNLLEQPWESYEGASLLPTMNGDSMAPDRCVYSQYSGNPGVGTIRRAVINQQFKYIYDENGNQELYHLKDDPYEMHNLAKEASYQDITASMHQKCVAFHLKQDDFILYN